MEGTQRADWVCPSRSAGSGDLLSACDKLLEALHVLGAVISWPTVVGEGARLNVEYGNECADLILGDTKLFGDEVEGLISIALWHVGTSSVDAGGPGWTCANVCDYCSMFWGACEWLENGLETLDTVWNGVLLLGTRGESCLSRMKKRPGVRQHSEPLNSSHLTVAARPYLPR